jgi:hypothetical protein
VHIFMANDRFDGQGALYRTGPHWGQSVEGTPPSKPLVTGPFDGLVTWANHNLQPIRRPRPFLVQLRPDGTWRSWGFINPDGTSEPVSPQSSDEARERQRDRYDRAHYGYGHWDYDLSDHERYPNTVEVNEQGEEQP